MQLPEKALPGAPCNALQRFLKQGLGLAASCAHSRRWRSERFGLALLLAVCLHAALIAGLHFTSLQRETQPPVLEVTLVPSLKPEAQQPRLSAPANANQAADEATPAASADVEPNAALQQADAATGGAAAAAAPKPQKALNYAALSSEIAAFGLDAAARSGTGGPRIRRLSSATPKSAVEAAYLEMWRQRVERIGNANYPAEAAYGDLRLQVLIHHDGALLDARVVEASGIAELDQAALDIVRLAAPFAQFSVDMRKSYDQLEILRLWRFSRSGAQLVE